MHAIRRRSDGSIDMDFYRARALQERGAYLANRLAIDVSLPSLAPAGRRRVKFLLAAFVLATGAFWATILTAPPTTEAGPQALSLDAMQRNGPVDPPVPQAGTF